MGIPLPTEAPTLMPVPNLSKWRELQRLCCKHKGDAVNLGQFCCVRGTCFMDKSTPFKWRHFEADIILLCVRWYLRYSAPLPRSGRDDARAGFARRPHHHLPLGPALCSRSGETMQAAPESMQRFLEGG